MQSGQWVHLSSWRKHVRACSRPGAGWNGTLCTLEVKRRMGACLLVEYVSIVMEGDWRFPQIEVGEQGFIIHRMNKSLLCLMVVGYRYKTILPSQVFHALRPCTIWSELCQAHQNGNVKLLHYQMPQMSHRHSIIVILRNAHTICSSDLIWPNIWNMFQWRCIVVQIMVIAYIMKCVLCMSGISSKWVEIYKVMWRT